MKKIVITLLAVVALNSNAQNLSTFGLSSNPNNLTHNPAADPLTAFHLNYAGVNSSIGMNHTAGEIFATTDILANLSELNTTALSIRNETNVDLLHIGFKAGKNYLFGGYTQNITVGLDFDTDISNFVKYGFGDGNGNLDLNYQGDFSDFGVSLDVTNDVFVGLQRSFLENKLRLGISAHQIGYALGMRIQTDAFSINSEASAISGRNDINVNYDFTIASVSLLDVNANTDQLSDLGNALIATTALINNLTSSSNNTTSINFGATYKPIDKISLQFSMNGLGTSPIKISTDVAKRLAGGVAIDGFEIVSNASDTLNVTVRNEIDSYSESISNGLNTNFVNTSFDYEYSVPQVTNAALNYHVKGQSYLGVHYTQRTNSLRDYEYLGFTSLLWLHKNVQLKGAYYLSMTENNTDLITSALQFRITPLLQVYVGTATTSEIATIASSLGGSIMVGSATQGANFTAGISMVFFDNRFKKNDEAKKKATDVKSLSPADQKKVDDAYKKSDTVKDNK